jgi:hypothetical protein
MALFNHAGIRLVYMRRMNGEQLTDSHRQSGRVYMANFFKPLGVINIHLPR